MNSIYLVIFIFIPQFSLAKSNEYFSGPQKIHLLELYSSEGCSSCPPADRWLAEFRKNKSLWEKIIPVEFHVDYWNQLGWVDPLSNKLFSNRQKQYANAWNSASVYTPGFVLDGKEWKISEGLPEDSVEIAGQLKVVHRQGNKFVMEFSSAKKEFRDLVGHLVILGNGLVSKVPRGENAGKTLKHEFVVLKWSQENMKKVGNVFKAEFSLPLPKDKKAQSYSLAGWVQSLDDMTPIQAVGGDFKP